MLFAMKWLILRGNLALGGIPWYFRLSLLHYLWSNSLNMLLFVHNPNILSSFNRKEDYDHDDGNNEILGFRTAVGIILR